MHKPTNADIEAAIKTVYYLLEIAENAGEPIAPNQPELFKVLSWLESRGEAV